MRKTRKEKIEAHARRERFLYSLLETTSTSEEKKSPNQQEKPARTTNQPQELIENFSYLKKDLRRIIIFTLLAFLTQIILYLTIF